MKTKMQFAGTNCWQITPFCKLYYNNICEHNLPADCRRILLTSKRSDGALPKPDSVHSTCQRFEKQLFCNYRPQGYLLPLTEYICSNTKSIFNQ